VHSATYVDAGVTCIVSRPDGARRSRAIQLLPDPLPPENFR
jgi:hypothetical protein